MHACLVMYCVDCSPPGSSVHGLSQAETREWVATPSSALGRSGWSRDLGGSGSSGDGWVGLEVWLCPLAAPSWDPSPRHQGGLEAPVLVTEDQGRAKGQRSPGKGDGWGGHACGTRLTLQIKNHLPVCCSLSESCGNRGGMQGAPEGAGREQGTAGLRVGPAGPSPPGQLPTASSALRLGSTVPPQVVLASAPRCPPGWSSGCGLVSHKLRGVGSEQGVNGLELLMGGAGWGLRGGSSWEARPTWPKAFHLVSGKEDAWVLGHPRASLLEEAS